MNLATTFNLKVQLRPEMCPKVLTITTCETITVHTDDGPIAAYQLVTTGQDGITYTVRLNSVTAEQLVRLFGPETNVMTGKQVFATQWTKGDRSYISFANAPAQSTPAPQRLPATGKNLPPPLTPEPPASTHKAQPSKRQ